ncbi:MAG: hypothetical protein WCV81_03310 [Microgenomates group bacterium]|jgi:hypothetical protein
MISVLIISLSVLTVVYFIVGLTSYFLGSEKTMKFGLPSLVVPAILVVMYIIFNDSEKEHIASAIALGLLFLVLPLASFTIGMLFSKLIKYFKNRNTKI